MNERSGKQTLFASFAAGQGAVVSFCLSACASVWWYEYTLASVVSCTKQFSLWPLLFYHGTALEETISVKWALHWRVFAFGGHFRSAGRSPPADCFVSPLFLAAKLLRFYGVSIVSADSYNLSGFHATHQFSAVAAAAAAAAAFLDSLPFFFCLVSSSLRFFSCSLLTLPENANWWWWCWCCYPLLILYCCCLCLLARFYFFFFFVSTYNTSPFSYSHSFSLSAHLFCWSFITTAAAAVELLLLFNCTSLSGALKLAVVC